MKIETLIYEKVRKVIPDGSKKTVFFAAIENDNYEMFFYAFIDGKTYQCFELAEKDILNGNELDVVFSQIVSIIRESKIYKSDKKNIVTIKVDIHGLDVDIVYEEKDSRLYKIKKEWEKENIN